MAASTTTAIARDISQRTAFVGESSCRAQPQALGQPLGRCSAELRGMHAFSDAVGGPSPSPFNGRRTGRLSTKAPCQELVSPQLRPPPSRPGAHHLSPTPPPARHRRRIEASISPPPPLSLPKTPRPSTSTKLATQPRPSAPSLPPTASTMTTVPTSSDLGLLTPQRGSVDGAAVGPVEGPGAEGGGTTFEEASLNAINILLGVGLLSIPFALSEGGWSALAVLGLLGAVTNYTGKVLGRCQEHVCLLSQRPEQVGTVVRGLASYEDIGEAAYGPVGRSFITAILYTELVGTCGLFFILEGDNLSRLLGGPPETYMLASALALIPTTWLPDLSALAGLGALGALAAFSILGVVVYTYITTGLPVGPGHVILELNTLPFTFGLLAFVFAGHAVFPNIKSSMRSPEQYPKMLDLTYIVVALVCALVGSIGYQMYGNLVAEEITLNLPKGLVATGATCLIVVNPFTKFALTMEPVARGLEEATGLLPNLGGDASLQPAQSARPLLHTWQRIMARTSLGLTALALATTVPFFGAVMALIGSCLTLAVSVMFPSLAYIELFHSSTSRYERMWNYFVVLLGGVCAIAGTYTAIGALQSDHSGLL